MLKFLPIRKFSNKEKNQSSKLSPYSFSITLSKDFQFSEPSRRTTALVTIQNSRLIEIRPLPTSNQSYVSPTNVRTSFLIWRAAECISQLIRPRRDKQFSDLCMHDWRNLETNYEARRSRFRVRRHVQERVREKEGKGAEVDAIEWRS